ncbi:MAG: tRNA (5-methylaminomethyl-2-thiouridine)(34)-methyltransferase MnmD [Roseicyclus sp.]
MTGPRHLDRPQADDQPLDWRGTVPVSRRFQDPFYSLEDGLAETRHVFLGGNGLPARFRDGFRIAELGFGTGLNVAAALLAWRAAGVAGRLHVTSFEAFPLPPGEAERALAAFPETAPAVPLIRAALSGAGPVEEADITLTLVRGDARETLPHWGGCADAWFLDGFAPARNPELWEPGLLAQVARHTATGGTCATYSAAGDVRRALSAAGFSVERRPGFGAKRHMSTGRLP